MAAFNGNLALSPIYTATPSNPALGSKDTNGVVDFFLPTTVLIGTGSDTQPVTEPANAQTGNHQHAFGFLEWYNKIHIEPGRLDLGNVISTQVRSVAVFSSYFVERTLNDVTAVGDEGLVLTEPVATPATFAPWQERTYELSIGTSGPATVDAVYTFDFDVIDIDLEVTGNRIVAWHFAPNWIDPVRERLLWLTDVMRAEDGSEQRAALREGPRQQWEFTFDVTGSLRRVMEHQVWGWGARIWALPIWPDGAQLTAAVTAGDTSITVDTTTRDYHVDGIGLIIADDGLSYESFEIETVNAGSLDLPRELTQSWPAGSWIYPARTARLTQSQGLSRFTRSHSTGQASFETVEQIVRSFSAEPTYRSYPVLEDEPNWRDRPEMDYRRQLEVFDSLTGAQHVVDRSEVAAPAQTVLWTAFGRTEADALRAFLYARAARHKGIWIPTWTSDLVLAATASAITTNIDVEACGLVDFVDAGLGRRDIRIELTDGTVIYRRVSGFATVDASTERMTISSALGQVVTVADVARISWMMFARLDADEVEIEWPSAGLAEALITLTGGNNDV